MPLECVKHLEGQQTVQNGWMVQTNSRASMHVICDIRSTGMEHAWLLWMSCVDEPSVPNVKTTKD
jgi:hypothetical protein